MIPFSKKRVGGFSLLEVVISLGFLMSLTVAITSMLRAGFDVKQGLSQRARVLHRMSVAMEKVANDLQHAYIVPTKDTLRNGIGRSTKTLFKIDKGNDADKLYFTTSTKRPVMKGRPESDQTFVVYELRDSKIAPGRKDLYRGETAAIPLDFRDEPPMRLIAEHIKSFQVEFWRGDQWSKDKWDSGSRDTRNKIPRLIKLRLEAYLYDRVDGDGQDESVDEGTDILTTVVNVTDALNYEEMKAQNTSIKWGAF